MAEKYISLKEAAERLKVTRPSLYHYIDVLKLEKKRFPLDRQTYLKMSDFEQIKTLREQMAERNNPAA
jgi:predicted DNA-binding transcriptional regulator AlpA